MQAQKNGDRTARAAGYQESDLPTFKEIESLELDIARQLGDRYLDMSDTTTYGSDSIDRARTFEEALERAQANGDDVEVASKLYARIEQLRWNIVIRHRNVAKRSAIKFGRPHGLSDSNRLDDFIQVAVLGIFNATVRFRTSMGVLFSTYAAWWIKSSLQVELGRRELVAGCNDFRRKRAVVFAHIEHLEKELGRKPSPEEISRSTRRFSPRLVQSLMVSGRSTLSLDSEDDPDTRPLSEVIGDDEAIKEGHILDSMDLKRCLRAIPLLPERYRFVIERRYGLEGRDVMTLAEIGQILRISPQRVRQIEIQSIQKLRDHVLDGKELCRHTSCSDLIIDSVSPHAEKSRGRTRDSNSSIDSENGIFPVEDAPKGIASIESSTAKQRKRNAENETRKNRKKEAIRDLIPAVIEIVTSNPHGISGRSVAKELQMPEDAVTAALKLAVDQGKLAHRGTSRTSRYLPPLLAANVAVSFDEPVSEKTSFSTVTSVLPQEVQQETPQETPQEAQQEAPQDSVATEEGGDIRVEVKPKTPESRVPLLRNLGGKPDPEFIAIECVIDSLETQIKKATHKLSTAEVSLLKSQISALRLTLRALGGQR